MGGFFALGGTMIHPFAIGATISDGTANHPSFTVLGYVDTPIGGRIVACRYENNLTFCNGTPVFQLDPAKYTEVITDPLRAIAARVVREHDSAFMRPEGTRLFKAVHAALIEARDAS